MNLITSEFGDDLNNLRMAKDFNDKSLAMLVHSLKQGVNIFDPEEKRIVLGGGGGGAQK
jgi:ribosome assembly protein 3